MPGPVPERSENLSRARDAKRGDRPEVTKGQLRPVEDVPGPDPEWHDIAQQLYLSLAESGQADFYQKSDWLLAYSLCEDLSYYKRRAKRSGQMLQTIMSALERLLVAEGDRRRVRIELSEPEPDEEEASVVAIADYRKELGAEVAE